MAVQTDVQKKHIFKFNFRCLLDSFFSFFLFSSPSPNSLANAFGLWKSKAKLPGDYEHVRKSLDNAAFWKCGDSSCVPRSVFRAVSMQNVEDFNTLMLETCKNNDF